MSGRLKQKGEIPQPHREEIGAMLSKRAILVRSQRHPVKTVGRAYLRAVKRKTRARIDGGSPSVRRGVYLLTSMKLEGLEFWSPVVTQIR